MNLEITLKSQLYALKELIVISLVYFGFIFFLFVKVEFNLFKILFLSTLFLYLLVFFLPVIILHINYLEKNKYKCLLIDKNKLILGDVPYSIDNIEEINIFATYQHFNDSVGVSALPYNDYYYYLEICLNDGGKIFVSSLFHYKIDKIFKDNFSSIRINEKPSTFISLLIR